MTLHSNMQTFDEITAHLLNQRNCSIRCDLGFIQDLHRFVHTDIEIVKSYPDPRKSEQCKMIKEKLLYLANNYKTLKKGVVNSKPFF